MTTSRLLTASLLQTNVDCDWCISILPLFHCSIVPLFRTFENTREMYIFYMYIFYISLEFSNASRALSQCNTRLRLLYLLIQSMKCAITLYIYT